MENVNTVDNESLPYISKDGKELWFTRTYRGTPAVYRSKNVLGSWTKAEIVVS